jgi:hypothetical protein
MSNQIFSPLDNPHDSIESCAFELFKELCGQYEWCTDVWRTKTRKVLEALIAYYDSDYHADVSREMAEMYEDALDDARVGRGDAEVENLLRDGRLARQQAISEQDGV